MSSPSSSGEDIPASTRRNLDAMQSGELDSMPMQSGTFNLSTDSDNPEWTGPYDDTLMYDDELYGDDDFYTPARRAAPPTASQRASEKRKTNRALERERRFVKDWFATVQASSATPELVEFAESNDEIDPGLFGNCPAAFILADEDEDGSKRQGYGVFDIDFVLSRIMRLPVPHTCPHIFTQDILITDTLAKALVLQSQAEFETRAIFKITDACSVFANSLKALSETGYTEEGLTHFIEEQEWELDDPKDGVTWTLESKMNGIRRCHITVSPPTNWTPAECVVYKLTVEEKFYALQQLTAQGRAFNAPRDWQDVPMPTDIQREMPTLIAALGSSH